MDITPKKKAAAIRVDSKGIPLHPSSASDSASIASMSDVYHLQGKRQYDFIAPCLVDLKPAYDDLNFFFPEIQASQNESLKRLSDPSFNTLQHYSFLLISFVETRNIYAIEKDFIDFKNLYIDRWINNKKHSTFSSTLRYTEQASSQAKRKLGSLSDREQVVYFLGKFDGLKDAFQDLLAAEDEEQRIVSLACAQSARTDQILMVLYTTNNGQGMRHRELADHIHISYSSLSNIMKRILQSGAVTAERSGKNTFYTLTTAGQRYCAQKQQSTKQKDPSGEFIREARPLIDSLSRLAKKYEIRPKYTGSKKTAQASQFIYPPIIQTLQIPKGLSRPLGFSLENDEPEQDISQQQFGEIFVSIRADTEAFLDYDISDINVNTIDVVTT